MLCSALKSNAGDRMYKIFLFVFMIVPFLGHAQARFEELTVVRKKTPEGQSQLCLKQFAKPGLKCLTVQPWTGAQIQSPDSDLKITELALTEFSVGPAGKDGIAEFGATIQWQGKGAGMLSIAGPKGQIFAVGRVAGSDISIDQFSDESLSQQFDRGVLFGESDAIRLHAATKIWLERVVRPAIAEYLSSRRLP